MRSSPLLLYILAVCGAAAAFDIRIPVHFDTLGNGLKILAVPDTTVAVVSCRLYYFVGSMYEGPGTTGFSHMYEHMLFKGTKTLGTSNYKKEIPFIRSLDSLDAIIQGRIAAGASGNDSAIHALKQQQARILERQRAYVKKDEIWELYLNNGGTNLNAWTAADMTAYIVTLPKNKIELFFWIESDRMRNTILREFTSERDVVMEERQMRCDNQPLSKYLEQLNALFYIAHPYRQPTIGWASDIRSFTRVELESYAGRYYTPDNALLVLVGNVTPGDIVKQADRYFGAIKRAEQPKREVVTREPAAFGERRITVRADAEPRIDILFQIPGYPNDDLFALDVMEGILSGRSGRLYRKLVTESQLCTGAGASNAFRLHNSEFHLWATLKATASPEKVEQMLMNELELLKQKPPTQREMQRNKNSIRMSFIQGISNLEGLSDRLAWFERLRSWKDLLDYPDKIARVETEHIPAIAQRYFDWSSKTTGLLLPEANQHSSIDAEAPGARKH